LSPAAFVISSRAHRASTIMQSLFILQDIFREVFDDELLVITPETASKDVDDWDSAAQVKLLLTIEERFSFEFTEDEVSAIKNVGGFLEAIQRRKSRRHEG
jgi:acyl carrier protein